MSGFLGSGRRPGTRPNPNGGEGSALVTGSGPGHIPALDGVRGLAIVMVLVAHLTLGEPQSLADRAVSSLQAVGWIGVDLFFVLSGFLITGILIDTRDRPDRFRSFYLRRVLRIFPLYYAALAVLFFGIPRLLPSTADQLQPVIDNQVWYWTYFNNIFTSMYSGGQVPMVVMHFWSLALEEQFYLVWPLLVYSIASRFLLRVSIALFGVTLALGMLHWIDWSTAPSFLRAVPLYGRMGGLLLGAMVAILWRDERGAGLLVRLSRPTAAVALVTVTILYALQPGLPWTPAVLTLGVAALQLGFAALIVLVLRAPLDSTTSRFFQLSPLRACGRYSYAMYVVHPALLVMLKRGWLDRSGTLERFGYSLAQPIVLLTGGLATFAVAYASWHLYEKHFLSLRDQIAPRTRTSASTAHPTREAHA